MEYEALMFNTVFTFDIFDVDLVGKNTSIFDTGFLVLQYFDRLLTLVNWAYFQTLFKQNQKFHF